MKSYSIQQRGEQFCVVDDDTGEAPEGRCHATQADAEAQMAAIGMHAGKQADLRDCLSRTIPHLIRAGHDTEQAVAIAYSECEAGKASPLQDCVSEKVREMIRQGCERDQALAIAYRECRGGKGTPFEALVDDQQAQFLKAFAEAYRTGGDVLAAEGAAWAALGLDAQKAAAALEGCCGDEPPDPADRLIAFGQAIKALDEPGRIGGYLVAWGTPRERDLQNEYFTPETDFCLDWYPVRPALYHHGLDGQVKGLKIGILDALRSDEVGLWAEAQLDLHNQYVRAIYELVKRGVLAWSSGSLPQLVEVASGKIVRWPIVEGSCTPTPADHRYTTAIAPLKALKDLPALEGLLKAIAAGDGEREAASDLPSEPPPAPAEDPEAADSHEDLSMNQEQLMQIATSILQTLGIEMSDEDKQALVERVLAELGAPDQATMADPAAATAFGKTAGEKLVAAIQAWAAQTALAEGAAEAAKTAAGALVAGVRPASRLPQGLRAPAPGAHIEVRSRYHDLNAADMSYLASARAFIKRAQSPFGAAWRPDDAFLREMADKAGKAYSAGQMDLSGEALKAVLAIKANELDHSTLTDYGDEWVPDLWLDELWQKVRLENVVASQFAPVDMPSNPYELPIEGTDPTVYFVPETTAESELLISGAGAVIPDSQVGTGKVTLTAKKLALRVGFSSELVEDSIIPLVSTFREQALRTMQDAIDNVLLNGDTAASANINYDGGTPAVTEKYKAFDALRKLPIVTTTANAIDAAGAAPTLTVCRSVRATLSRAYNTRVSELVWFATPETYLKLLNVREMITVDKAGPEATAQTGEIRKLDGIPLFPTAEFPLTASDGKVTYNAAGTLGSLLLAYRPYWRVGYRRKITGAIEYLSYYDAYQMTYTVRLALVRRDADCAAILYDIGVA